MKLGVVDVGGGLRGIYAAGVFDFCIDNNIKFDFCAGVSAGSANIASYMAGQRGRNYSFYAEYSMRDEYMSFKNFIKKKSFIDLDYVYGTLSVRGGENPLDYHKLEENPCSAIVVATDSKTGKAKYFDKSDFHQDDYNILKASSAIPFVCHPYKVGFSSYFDGALSDPIPIDKAFEAGCDRIVLILTKPVDFVRVSSTDEKIAKLIKHKYPEASKGLELRSSRYNAAVKLAKKYQEEGKTLIIAPDDTCGVQTLTRDREALDKLYRKGYHDGEAILSFIA